MAVKEMTIRLVLSGPKQMLDECGDDLVDRVLDAGVFQDAINEVFAFEGVKKARVSSCSIGREGERMRLLVRAAARHGYRDPVMNDDEVRELLAMDSAELSAYLAPVE